MDLGYVLGQKTRFSIFYLLIQKPGITVTEIAKQLKLSQPAISQHLSVMEKGKMIRQPINKYTPGPKGGVARNLYPSLQGIYEQIARIKRKVLTDKEYEELDSHLFSESARKIWIKRLDLLKRMMEEEEKKPEEERIDRSILMIVWGLETIPLIQKTIKSSFLKSIQRKFR